MKRTITLEVICFLFIFLFVYAAVSKLAEYETFTVQLGQSPLVTAFAHWIAWAIPALEILISILLIIPKTRLMALYACLSLMTMFTTYIVCILTLSVYVPCSCGGILESLGWAEHLIFNVAFLVLSIIGIVLCHRQESNPEVNPTTQPV